MKSQVSSQALPGWEIAACHSETEICVHKHHAPTPLPKKAGDKALLCYNTYPTQLLGKENENEQKT